MEHTRRARGRTAQGPREVGRGAAGSTQGAAAESSWRGEGGWRGGLVRKVGLVEEGGWSEKRRLAGGGVLPSRGTCSQRPLPNLAE